MGLAMALMVGSVAAGGARADAAEVGPALAVDVGADRQAISEDIYGMNFAGAELAAELRLPVHRWGGNATTRYHFRYDTTNRAHDWFFENIVEANPDPSRLPDGSSTDRFHEQNEQTGTGTLLTVPLIGWAPKARAQECGFSVAKYGPQERTDQWAPDCGNGVRPDGTPITGNDPHDTSVEIGPEYITDWLGHLTSKYGTAANGGVRYYNLDNEPDLWHGTHRDVHPDGAGYDELRDRTYQIAAAVKAADPSAKTLGPTGWGFLSLNISGLDHATCSVQNCWSNPPDRAAHGGVPFGEWYLAQLRAHEQRHGVRILDYYDNHIYPQQAGVAFGGAGDEATQALRLRSTRQLWDPTYTDESWINDEIMYIPRMKDMVARNYPGTKVAITEYNWGAYDHVNGALTQADVLGIFGREGLDLAALWTAPQPNQPVTFAFRLYRNYDGQGGQFGNIRVRATSADQDRLAIYGAERGSDGATTLMVINKTGSDLTSPVSLAGRGAGTAQVYRYSAANPTTIVRAADQPVSATGFSATFPANSITLLVLPPSPRASVAVEYRNLDPATGDNQIKPGLRLTNTGSTPLDLSTVKVRYWFTRDSAPRAVNSWCDYATLGCTKITRAVTVLPQPRTGADAYLEVGFTEGVLAPGASTGQIQLRMSKSDWSPFTETGDHSWRAAGNTYAPQETITAYVNGARSSGTEPQ